MSDTPRTDAFMAEVYQRHAAEGLDDQEHYRQAVIDLAEKAREYERKLAAMTAERDSVMQECEELRSAINQIYDNIGDPEEIYKIVKDIRILAGK